MFLNARRFLIFKFVFGACILVFIWLSVKATLSSDRSNVHKSKQTGLKSLNQNVQSPSHETLKLTDTKSLVFLPTVIDGKDINPEIVKFVQIKENETKDPFVNLHSYKFTMNSRKCKFGSTFMVIVIHSAPKHFQERSRIRTTFGSVNIYRQRNITTVFMIGTVETKSLQEDLKKESEKYGDIVQGNFEDKYSNLLKKHIMDLHWYKYNCNAKYILKLDDDTFINPYRMVDHLIETKPGRGIWCKIAEKYEPLRETAAKYYTSMAEYPFRIFPDFCVGFAYLTTPETWDLLYTASETTRFMKMDDVYVTGILPVKTKVPKYDFSNILLPCIEKDRFDKAELRIKPFVCYLYGRAAFRQWDYVEKNEK